MASSARSRYAGPRSRVKCARIRPDWCRNKCSSRAPVSGDLSGPALVSSPKDVSHLDCPAVVQMRKGEGALNGFVIISRLNGVVAAQYLLAFAVWPVGSARLAAVRADDLAGVPGQPFRVLHKRALRPGHIFLGGLLHFLGAERLVPLG